MPKRDEYGTRTTEYKRNYGIADYEGQSPDLLELTQNIIDGLEAYKQGSREKYPNNLEGFQTFRERTIAYFRRIEEFNRDSDPDSKYGLVPDIEGWSIWLGISRQTLRTYEKRSGDFGEFIRYTKTAILGYKKRQAESFRMPPILYLFDATNNHDYYSTNQFTVKMEQQQSDEYEKERQAKLTAELVRTLTQQDHDQDPEPLTQDGHRVDVIPPDF